VDFREIQYKLVQNFGTDRHHSAPRDTGCGSKSIAETLCSAAQKLAFPSRKVSVLSGSTRFPIRCCHANPSQNIHDLLPCVLSAQCGSRLLLFKFLSKRVVEEVPGIPDGLVSVVTALASDEIGNPPCVSKSGYCTSLTLPLTKVTFMPL
jgi:hypothetical protein